MKKIFSVFLVLLLFSVRAAAQNLQPERFKIALFAPIYLDSVFDEFESYRYDKAFPKFVNPGLEFYMGAQMALDSLKKGGAPLDVHVFDSRSQQASVAQQINNSEISDAGLIIAHANTADVRILAEAAQKKKVPFVSATLPNDAGITNNPYYVILNSTLPTHIEGIYRYLQKYHNLDKIIVFRKSGSQEDQIRTHLQEISKNTLSVPLKISYEEIGAAFDVNRLTRVLDSNRKTVCIAGSLDEAFGIRLAQNLASVTGTYPLTLIGMPTWDGITEFTKNEYKPLEIVYSSPFYYTRPTTLSTRLSNDFASATNGRPSDMFYRGYETTLRFALLLLDTKKDVASNLTRKGNFVFTAFDIQPVFLNKQAMTLDYFENKKLYFVRISNGVKTAQ